MILADVFLTFLNIILLASRRQGERKWLVVIATSWSLTMSAAGNVLAFGLLMRNWNLCRANMYYLCICIKFMMFRGHDLMHGTSNGLARTLQNVGPLEVGK